MRPNAFFLPLLFQIYPAAVSSLHQGIQVLCRGCWYFPLFLVPAANSYTVNFFPWHTSQSSLTSVVRMVHRSGEYDFVLLDRCKQPSCFCCCKGSVSHAVQIHHLSSAAPWTSILRCKHSNEAPSYNFLYGFCSKYGLKCGKPLSVIFYTQTDSLSSPPTAETLSAVAHSSGRTWHKPKLSFQLIPEHQINSNLCLNTANTSHRQQPPSTAPGSRRALCIISLRGRWGQSGYSATPHYTFYCDCATAGNTTEPEEYFKTHCKWQNKHNFIFLLNQNEVRWVFKLLYTDQNHKDMQQNCWLYP